jgi:hypothetical protein
MKIELKKKVCKDVDRIHLAQERAMTSEGFPDSYSDHDP